MPTKRNRDVSKGKRGLPKITQQALAAARRTDKLLPHELLLLWANGCSVAGLTPDPAQQIYAAVAAAPYYAPKLAAMELKQDVQVRAVISASPLTPNQWARKYIDTAQSTLPNGPDSQQLVHQFSGSDDLIPIPHKKDQGVGGDVTYTAAPNDHVQVAELTEGTPPPHEDEATILDASLPEPIPISSVTGHGGVISLSSTNRKRS